MYIQCILYTQYRILHSYNMTHNDEMGKSVKKEKEKQDEEEEE